MVTGRARGETGCCGFGGRGRPGIERLCWRGREAHVGFHRPAGVSVPPGVRVLGAREGVWSKNKLRGWGVVHIGDLLLRAVVHRGGWSLRAAGVVFALIVALKAKKEYSYFLFVRTDKRLPHHS